MIQFFVEVKKDGVWHLLPITDPYYIEEMYKEYVCKNLRKYPKGLPEKLSLQVLKEYQEWIGDAEDYTWFTLQELTNLVGENKFVKKIQKETKKKEVRVVAWFEIR